MEKQVLLWECLDLKIEADETAAENTKEKQEEETKQAKQREQGFKL